MKVVFEAEYYVLMPLQLVRSHRKLTISSQLSFIKSLFFKKRQLICFIWTLWVWFDSHLATLGNTAHPSSNWRSEVCDVTLFLQSPAHFKPVRICPRWRKCVAFENNNNQDFPSILNILYTKSAPLFSECGHQLPNDIIVSYCLNEACFPRGRRSGSTISCHRRGFLQAT